MIFKLQSNRVWRSYLGGAGIDKLYGINEGKDGHFPEDWVASTVKAVNPGKYVENEGLSKTIEGILLKDIIEENPEKMLGEEQIKKYGANMSILVKLLDAAERLVIQVHPTVPFARKHFNSNFGKTESWYVIDTNKDAHIYLGFKKEITRERWVECFKKQNVAGMLDLLNKININKGDCFIVEGGVPHAIGGGCLMVELQEPTDLMVIPERITPSGTVLPDAKLHCGLGFDGMFDCFEYVGYTKEEVLEKFRNVPAENENGSKLIIGEPITDKFKMEELNVKSELITDYRGKYAIAVVLNGKGHVCTTCEALEIEKGEQLFISADEGKLRWVGMDLRVIICTP